MKKVWKVSFALIMCIALVACGGGGSKSSSTSSNEITVAKENDVISMDTRRASDGMSLEVITATTAGLVSIDKDGNVIPDLAESYETSEDQLTWTFKLRDAKWANGDAITANDFVYAWQENLVNPDSTYAYLFGESAGCVENADAIIEGSVDKKELGIKAVDDKTVEVKLTKPVSFFDNLMSFPPFFPLNQKFVEEQGDGFATTPDKYLSSGPYKLVTWEKGSKIVVEKNDTYWDKDAVKTDKLTFKIVAEASTAALDFESGSTDFVKLNSDLVDKYKDNDSYETVLEGYLWYLQYNYKNEMLANKNIRMALSLAVDRDKLANDVLKDGSIPAKGFVPAKLATGPDGKDYRETADEYLSADKVKAKEYWEKGLKELGVESITLSLLFEPSDPAKPAAEFIQSELTSTLDGLTLEMNSQPKENRLDLQKKGNFDVVLTRWGPDFADPTTYLSLMLDGNTFNFGKFQNAEYDALYAEAAQEADLEKRWQMLKDLEKMVMDDAAVAPMFQVGGASLVNVKVKGIETHAAGVPFIYKNAVKEK